jgi:hypothetical protein
MIRQRHRTEWQPGSDSPSRTRVRVMRYTAGLRCGGCDAGVNYARARCLPAWELPALFACRGTGVPHQSSEWRAVG